MRFLLDGMLGRLTRWLRILGCDANYSRNGSDADLIRQAREDSLVLLTCDVQLYRTAIARNVDCYLIQGNSESERLANLAARFNLELKIDTARSRCPACGALVKLVRKDEVATRIPKATFKLYQTFWICPNASCAKVYWQGSHWKRIEETLENARIILENKQHEHREKSTIPIS